MVRGRKRLAKEIPRRSFRLHNSILKNRFTQNLRRSPRLKNASSEISGEELVKTGKFSNVKQLLETGFFEGVPITCFSEDHQGEVPGIIKGSGFLCGCSQCNYNGEVLSAQVFEKHAGAKTKFETDHTFFSNGLNMYEVFQYVRTIPEEDVNVKILKLRVDLKQKQLCEEPARVPTKSGTATRSKRKRRETEFQRSIASVDAVIDKKPKGEEKLEGIHGNALRGKIEILISAVEFREHNNQDDASKRCTNDELEKDKSFEDSLRFLKCYRRYDPKRRLMDVQGLLSTGLLEGFRVTYERNEKRLEAYIRGAAYECGCSSCNYSKVITAREIERHVRELSKNPNENIYLDNGMTLYKLVKELKGIPLYLLWDFLEEKIKIPPNYNSFESWKGSFKMGKDSPTERSYSDRQPEVNSKHSSVQSKSRDEVSVSEATKNDPAETSIDGHPEGMNDLAKDIVPKDIFQSKSRDEVSMSEATKNTDWVGDSSHVRDNDSLKNLNSNSDKCLNQPNEFTNSNSQQCSVSKCTTVTDPAETIIDAHSEVINDPTNLNSKSRVEASISEATENTLWMGDSSHVRDNVSLENLDSNSDQCLEQPNENTNSNSQQCSAFKPTIVANPAKTIIDAQSEGINDLAKASVPKNTSQPFNVINTEPVSSGLGNPSLSSLEGTSVVCKGSLNISGNELHFSPASRKSRSSRTIKFIKRDYNFNVGPSALMHGTDKPAQKVKFKFYGAEFTTASDVTEAATVDPDYNPLPSGSKEVLTDEKRASLGGIIAKRRSRDVYLHKRIFEEGGLPDGTELTYRHRDKVLLTGFKLGSVIKCACHNSEWRPSQFEAHAGLPQRRQPYRNIYNSDGKTLHELSLELADVPRSSSVIPYSRPITHRQHYLRERAAKPLLKKEITQDFIVPTRLRLKRILQSQKGVIVRCTICKERRVAVGHGVDKKLMIFCNQCDRAYHVGCLEDQESFDIQDVFNGSWFCCTDCIWVHNCLKNICALGAKLVPTPFFDLLKKPHTTDNDPVNLSWQIFRGGNTDDRVLLARSMQLIRGAFKPILLGRLEMIRQMVFGKQVAGNGLDFRGVHIIMIKLDEEIISVAVIRVFGKHAAELPLVTTSKIWRQKGYFHMLLSLIEELLQLLQVRLLVSPVHNKMQSIWIDKFGFVKASDQKVQMLREHGVMLFEDTAVLEKEIRAIAD